MRSVMWFAVLLGLTIGARGELPLEEPPPDTPPAEPPRGIVVPAPEAQKEAGSLDELPAAAPPPDQPGVTVIRQTGKAPVYKRVPPPPPTADALLLDTGDELPGRCLEADGATVSWTLANVPQPVRFQYPGIRALKLAPVANPPAAAKTSWIVRLTNGDLLAGNELTLDAAHLELTTPAAGRLRLARQWVAALFREAPTASSSRTWQRLAEWDQVKKESAFGYDRPQGISRDVGLPDCAEIEFCTTATAGLLARGTLSAYLFAEPNNMARGSISFYLSRTTCHLMTPQDFGWQTQQAELRDLAANAWEAVTVRLNRKTGRLLLLVDGAVKHQFEFTPAAAAGERAIYFRQTLDATIPADAERLLVTPLPEDVELAVATQPGRVLFANGDSAAGELATLGANTFVVTTPTGRLELPVERFAGGWLAALGGGPAGGRDGDVSLGLRSGEELTGTLTGVSADRVTLDSAWGGTLTVPRAAVAAVRWDSAARQLARRQARAAAVTRQPGQPSGRPGKVQFVDGQQLPGTLVEFAADTVSWRLPAVAEPITLPRDRVVWAATTVPVLSADPPPATVRLTSGDRLSGELADADGQAVRLRPRHLAPLVVPLTHVVSLWPGAAPGLALEPGSGTTAGGLFAGGNGWTIVAPAAGGGGGAVTVTLNLGAAAAGGAAGGAAAGGAAAGGAAAGGAAAGGAAAGGAAPGGAAAGGAAAGGAAAGGAAAGGAAAGGAAAGGAAPGGAAAGVVAAAKTALVDLAAKKAGAGAATPAAGDANNQVAVVNGAMWFLNSGACHHQAALPERLALHLEMAKEDLGDANNLLTVTTLSGPDKATTEGQCSFMVRSTPYGANDGYVQMPAVKGQSGYNNLSFAERPWTAITAVWLVDRKLNEAILLADGRVCGAWKGSAPLADAGLLQFRAQTNADRLWRLRHVAVSEWRGSVELLGQAAPAGAVSVWRHDLTRVTGNLVRIADGCVLLEGDADGAGVPLAAVARLDFQSPNTPATAANAGEVRVFLPDGDQLTLAAARFDAGGLTGTTAALGTVTVPPAAVVRVEFRPAGAPADGKKP